MSNPREPHDSADFDGPRMEPWLAVMLSAFLPVIVIAFVPDTLHVVLAAAAVVLIGAGACMLVVEHRRRSR